jgi:hypothetical protein
MRSRWSRPWWSRPCGLGLGGLGLGGLGLCGLGFGGLDLCGLDLRGFVSASAASTSASVSYSALLALLSCLFFSSSRQSTSLFPTLRSSSSRVRNYDRADQRFTASSLCVGSGCGWRVGGLDISVRSGESSVAITCWGDDDEVHSPTNRGTKARWYANCKSEMWASPSTGFDNIAAGPIHITSLTTF